MNSASRWITSKQYTDCLREIGNKFLDYFRNRSVSLPLHIQIVCGLLSLPDVEKLLSRKPYLANVHDDDGRVPLMLHWHTSFLLKFLEYGADPNACDNRGNTVLMYQRYNMKLCKILLQFGADINAKNNDGISLISMALEDGLPIQPLLDDGAIWQPVDRNKKDTIFLNCLTNESIEVLSKIVSDNLPSDEIFHFARVWSGCHCQEKFEWLKQLKTFYPTMTKAAFSEKEKHIFEEEFNLRKRDISSESFMILLANMRDCLDEPSTLNKYLIDSPEVLKNVQNLEILEILLSAGEDPNVGIKWKRNIIATEILYGAVYSHNLEKVRVLLKYGVNPSTGKEDMDIDDTCVACAIRNNDLDILELLINANADLNYAIRCDRTPIITAIRQNNLPALKMLIEAGANPNLVDQYGRIPRLYLDEKNNSKELITYFETISNSIEEKV
ncbi:MAG: ankyrin repeat domain-containing protein [Victivallales bacterium]|nr:ankyrin repeat domain-containing protein [Victivallales bacterium]